MSHRFQATRFYPSELADPRRVHEAIQPFLDEVNGGLNEHNFATNAVVVTGMVDGAFGVQEHTAVEVADPYDPTVTPVPGDQIELFQTGSWEEVFGRDIDVGHPAILLVIANVTAAIDNSASTLVYLPPSSSWALAIDGVVFPESGPGGHEASNEYSLLIAAQASAGGITRLLFPVQAFLVMPVPPGAHRVALMVRIESAQALHTTRVLNRELIIDQLTGGVVL